MRQRFYLVLGLLLLIAASTAGFLMVTRPTGPVNLESQAVIPSYGSICFQAGRPIILLSGMLDTTVTSLFGSPDNITGIRLCGPEGDLTVTDWNLQMFSTDEHVGRPAAHLRTLSLEISEVTRPCTVTDIVFDFANGARKGFPFGNLQLVVDDATPAEDMVRDQGVLWGIYDVAVANLPDRPFNLGGMVISLDGSTTGSWPVPCTVVSLTTGNPLVAVVPDTVCQMDSVQALEESLRGDGTGRAACCTEGRGLPLALAIAPPPSGQSNTQVNIGFLVEPAPEMPPLAYLYFHPLVRLEVGGRTVCVSAAGAVVHSCTNVYSAAAKAWFEENGRPLLPLTAPPPPATLLTDR